MSDNQKITVNITIGDKHMLGVDFHSTTAETFARDTIDKFFEYLRNGDIGHGDIKIGITNLEERHE